MKKIKGIYLALVVVMVSSTLAHADPVVSTLPQTSSNSTGIGGTNDYAAGFIWDSAADFSFAELYLGVEGNPLAALMVSIFDSAGGSPGSVLMNLTGPTDITAPGLYTYSGAVSLIQGATYWLVASTGLYRDHENEFIWYDGTFGDTNYVDTKYFRPNGDGWTSSAVVSPAAFRVNAVSPPAPQPEPAPVPEPGTLALFGIGLVGMAARRRKKV